MIALVLFLGVYIGQPGGTRLLEVFSDGLYSAAAILGAVLLLLASTRFDRGLVQRRVWFMLGSGMALWAIAELVWAYFQLGIGEDVPYPSLADLIWGIGFAPLILGLFLGHRSLGVRLSNRQRILTVVVYAILLAGLAMGLLVPMYFDLPPSAWAEAVIGVCYLVGDLTLAFVAMLSLAVLWDGLVGRPWLPIAIGLLLFAISDTVFAYAAWTGRYSVGGNLLSGAIDVAYLAAYLSIALGAYRQATLKLADVSVPPKHTASIG
jgi:hypothetical protein